jgi:hypothetical protein
MAMENRTEIPLMKEMGGIPLRPRKIISKRLGSERFNGFSLIPAERLH